MNIVITILVALAPKRFKDEIIKRRKFILYAFIGGIAVLIDLFVFYALTQFAQTPTLLANTLSVFTAMIYSFVVNLLYNFQVKDKLLQRFVSFVAVTVFGYGVSTIMLWVLADILGFNEVLIKTLSLPIVLVVQFKLNSAFTFKKSVRETEAANE